MTVDMDDIPVFGRSSLAIRSIQRTNVTSKNLNRDDWKRECIAAQGGVCAFCGGRFRDGKDTCLDHDHTYSKDDPKGWRFVLCRNCNTTLGRVEKDRGWYMGFHRALVKYKFI